MARILQAHRNGLIKNPFHQPRGRLRAIPGLVPKGMTSCVVLNGPSLFDLIAPSSVTPAYTGSTYSFAATPGGIGFRPGGSSRVDVPIRTNDPGASSPNTFECLFYYDGAANDLAIIYSNGNTGYGLACAANGTCWAIGRFANAYVNGGSMVAGTLNHAVMTVLSDTITLYVNGKSYGTAADGGSAMSGSQVLRIGMAGFYTSANNANIHMAAYYNGYALSAAEVQARYLNLYGFLAPAERSLPALYTSASAATSSRMMMGVG